jgi:hypothetical protein
MKRYSFAVMLAVLSVATASAQSLSPNAPAPLKPGINDSQTDNFTGTHYWYFYANPGRVTVHCLFKGGGLLGSSMNSSLTFTLSDVAQTWQQSKKLVSGSTADARETTFVGNFKKRTEVVVSVVPVSGGLVRLGGEYQITVGGAVAFGQAKSGDPIVGTYMQMYGMTENIGLTKFKADGTIAAANGFTGTWKLFDPDTHTYTIVINNEHLSLIYRAGIGLVDPSDPNTADFKALK